MTEYIPFPAYATDAPIDISFVFADEVPAGKHGFMKVEGNKFVFEDGTPARFWGTNFNGGACFPEHDYAEKVARRLGKMGQNIVRFHQLDAEWNTPNIFQLTKGPVPENTRSLDPRSMDRLDYLIACLKKEGIYIYLDLLTYRRFKEGDGVPSAIKLGDSAKPYSIYNRRMIELQKEFASQVFNHFNPYTGLAYKDDPAIVMTEITNECDLFTQAITVEPYVSEFRQLFRAWLDENGMEYDAENGDLMARVAPVIRFKTHLHKAYYTEMMAYLREIGVRHPVTGTNWTQHAALFDANRVTDYTDGHVYHYTWKWGETEKFCINDAPSQVSDYGGACLAQMASLDKPFFISEWDVPWPNEYRAEGNLLFAAMGMLQGWSGYAIHTYSYMPSQEHMKILGKEMWSDAINGVPYREGIFSTWNDPAKFGLFYHCALITRRGDVAESGKRIGVKVDTDRDNYMGPAFTAAAEMSKIGFCLEDNANVDQLVTEPVSPVDLEKGEVLSDTGEMYRNWKKNYGWIDTPMTKSVYGFLAKNGKVEVNGMSVDCATDFATISVSSLSKDTIENANNIMLTAVGRAQNTGAEFVGERMVKWGTDPIQVEVIKATISIKTNRPNMKVWSVTPEGMYHGQIPTTYENGVLTFTIGEHWRSMYYLIQAE